MSNFSASFLLTPLYKMTLFLTSTILLRTPAQIQVMNQCRQTKIERGFSLIMDDSRHRKSGNFTAGVGRQYIGEIGSHRE